MLGITDMQKIIMRVRVNGRERIKIRYLAIIFLFLTGHCQYKTVDTVATEEGYPISRRNGWEPKKVKWRALKLAILGPSHYMISGENHVSVRIHIEVQLDEERWPKVIDFVQVIQRRIDENGTTINLIEIFPFFRSDRPNSPSGGYFSSTFEEIVGTKDWGVNYFRVHLGDKFADFTVDRRKSINLFPP